MKRGELAKKKRKGCLTALLVVWAVFMGLLAHFTQIYRLVLI